MHNKHQQRKNLRLKNYDYSQPGYYFITICTHNKVNLLSNIVGVGFHADPKIELTALGREIEKVIKYIDEHYQNINIDEFVIMPNHIHMIIIIQPSEKGRRGNLPLHKVIGQFKSYANRIYNDMQRTKNLQLWQRNYYEHIIRNEVELYEIRRYIMNNPLKWELDQYYNST